MHRVAITQPLIENFKKKGTLLFPTLKVEKNKVPFLFLIFAQGLRYSLFLIFGHACQKVAILEFRKWPQLSLWAKIEKAHFVFLNFKIWRKQSFVNFGWDILIFSFFVNPVKKVPSMAISQPLNQNCKNQEHFVFSSFKNCSKHIVSSLFCTGAEI